jgi:hypothetical protein
MQHLTEGVRLLQSGDPAPTKPENLRPQRVFASPLRNLRAGKVQKVAFDLLRDGRMYFQGLSAPTRADISRRDCDLSNIMHGLQINERSCGRMTGAEKPMLLVTLMTLES